jgi:hypothetical protein
VEVIIGVYIRPTGMTEELYRSTDEQMRSSGGDAKGI